MEAPAGVNAVTLPTELLQYIFEAACAFPSSGPFPVWPYKAVGVDPNGWRKMRGAINLTCQRWRYVALALPSLWKTIVIRSRPKGGSYSEGSVQESDSVAFPDIRLLTLELERSKHMPLELHIRSNHRRSREGHWETVLPYLNDALHLGRVYSLQAQVVSMSGHLGLFRQHQPLDRLQHLSLHWSSKSEHEKYIDLTGAVSLQNLSLTYYGRRHDADFEELGLKLPDAGTCAVRILRLEGNINISDVVQGILSCAATLESLRWIMYDIRPVAVAVQGRLDDRPFLQLESLRVDGIYPLICTLNIDAPNLLHLGVCAVSPPLRGAGEQFPTISRKYPQLRYLSTDLEPIDMPVSFLRSHPSLETITTAYIESLVAVFRDIPEAEAPPLPNLQSVWTSLHGHFFNLGGDEHLERTREEFRLLLRNMYSNRPSSLPFVVNVISHDLEENLGALNDVFEEYEGSRITLHQNWDDTLDSVWAA